MSIRIQCDSCQRTFQVPDSSEGKQTRCPSCQTLILIKRQAPQSDPETPVKVIREVATPIKATPIKAIPVKATPVKAILHPNDLRPSSLNGDESIAVSCLACGRAIRAPGRAAGKAIRCPGCQATIPVPNDFSFEPIQVQPIQAYTPQRVNNASASPLHDDSLWSAIPPASASVPYSGASGFDNPYAADTSYSGGGTRRGSSRTSRLIQYNIIGVLMMIWSGMIVLGCIVRPVALAIALSNLPPNATINYDRLTPVLIGTGIGIVIGLAIAYFMFQGGYNIFYQTDLESARQIAIFCAIPCCGTCLFPVGIWACFLLYGKNARRDFGR